MTADCTTKQGRIIDGATLRELTPPRINLSSSADVRRELAKVYRDVRQGRMDASEGTKLGYLLELMRKMIETEELEKRLAKIEANNEQLAGFETLPYDDVDASKEYQRIMGG
ncbi:MAG TPA: hypothetical protein PK693_10800 [Halothiobacillus sp.]|jgi:hypothetical protein|nr:hypothetical protein [Halothiobacillus sp.]